MPLFFVAVFFWGVMVLHFVHVPFAAVGAVALVAAFACDVFVAALLLCLWWLRHLGVVCCISCRRRVLVTWNVAAVYRTSRFCPVGGFCAPRLAFLRSQRGHALVFLHSHQRCSQSFCVRRCMPSFVYLFSAALRHRLGVKEENLAEYYRRKEENYRKVTFMQARAGIGCYQSRSRAPSSLFCGVERRGSL